MAIFTQLNQQDITQILNQYDIGDLIDHEGIVEGIDNSNFKLTTTNGKYILTVFENRIKPEEIPYFIALMAHFKDSGLNCPTPISQKNGDTLSTVKGKPYVIFSFLNGNIVKPKDITLNLCSQLGKCLAQMHLSGQKTDLHRDNSMGLDAWKLRLEKTQEKQPTATTDWTSLFNEIAYIKENWPQNLPQGNVHLDLFPNNTFITNGKLSGVIDFYFAATDFLAYDLAITMNAWCFENGKFNNERWNNLRTGYESVRPITIDEKNAFKLLSRAAAMRFLSSRLHDLAFHDPKNSVIPHDPQEYLNILEFHRDRQVF